MHLKLDKFKAPLFNDRCQNQPVLVHSEIQASNASKQWQGLSKNTRVKGDVAVKAKRGRSETLHKADCGKILCLISSQRSLHDVNLERYCEAEFLGALVL
jgi:hypothetical protein